MRHTLSILLLLLGINPIIAQTSLSTNSATICSGGNTTVTATNLDQTVTFIWTSFNGQPSQTGNFLNVASATQSDTWTCTTNNTNSQPIDSDIFTVTVNALPVVSAGANQTLCAGTSVTLSGSGAVSYTWNNNVQNGVTFTPTSTQTYTVTGTDANGCTNTDQAIVTVNPTPVIPTQNISACSGTIFTSNPQNNIPTTIIPNGTTYTWTQPIVTGNITGGSAQNNQATISQTLINPTNLQQTATYTVTPTSGSCVGANFTVIVTVNPTPILPTQTQTICSGNPFLISPTNGAGNTVPSGTTYSWTNPTVTGGIIGGSVHNNQANISQTLTNPTNVAQTATYTVTPLSGICQGINFQVVVTVNPLPVLTPSASQTICGGTPTTLTSFSNSVAGGTISWTLSNPGLVPGTITGYQTSGIGQIPVSTINNTGTAPYTLSYQVTPTANGCSGSASTYTITVNPLPVTNFSSANQIICSGGNTNAVNLTSPTGSVSILWSVPGGVPANIANFNPTSGTSTIPSFANLTNSTNSPITISIQAQSTTTGAALCNGALATYTITVNPIPSLILPSNQTICGGLSTSSSGFFNTVNGGSFSYTLQNSGNIPANVTGYAPSGTGQIPPVVINNVGTNAHTLSYSITPIANNCSGTPSNYTITVNPAAITTFSELNQSICSGGNTNAVNLSSTTNGVSFSWSVQGGAPANIGNFNTVSGSSTIPVYSNLTNTTNAPITITFVAQASASGPANCIGVLATYTITVIPLPSMTSAISTSVCSGTALNFNLAATIGSTYSWLAASNANVNSESTIAVISSTINDNLTQSTFNPQNVIYTVTPTSTVGLCVGSPQIVTITVNPLPSMTSGSSTQVCSGTPLNFGLLSSIPSSYSWIAAGNANVNGESTIAVNSSTINNNLTQSTLIPQNVVYTVTPTSTVGSCAGSPQTITITVKPLPVMTSVSSTPVCSGTPLNFILTSTIGSTYSWVATNNVNVNNESTTAVISSTINDNLTQSTFIPQNVVYTVTPTSTGGSCTGNFQIVTITVNPLPSMSSGSSTQVCSGTPLNFNLAATIGSTYSWVATNNANVNNESTSAVISSTINNNLTQSTFIPQNVVYTVTPTSIGGSCTGSPQIVTITVNPLPIMNTAISTSVCSGTPLNFNLTSTIGTSYSWVAASNAIVNGESTTAVISPIINNTLTQSTLNTQNVVYTVTPTSTVGSCIGNQQIVNVTVNPLPDSTITPNGATTFCSGGSVTLSAIPNYSSYTWNKDGIVIPGAASATYFATQSGVYSVSITNQYSCNSMESITVNNLTIPVAAVSNASPANFFCQGNNTTLNASANCQGCNLSYQWLVNGTNTPGTNPSLIVNATGNYSVVIGNSLNGIACLDTSNNIFITSVQIVPPSFAGLPDSICVNETFVLPQLSNNNIAGTWNPLIISNQSSSYTFTPLQGQCASPYSWNVQLVALPQPSLGNDLVICAGDSTILISQGFNSYLWSNGSSDSSITVAPSATTQYILSVTNSLGCVGADSINVAVNPVPPLPFISGSESLCLNSLNQVYSTTPTVNWLIWNIDGANIYSGQYTNEVHLDLTSSDTLWINLTEHILNTGCYSTNTLMVLVDTNASAPPYVNVLPLGNQNDFLCAPQAIGIFRWGKIDKNTNDIYFYPSVYTYHNFTVLDTVNYFYFVDHGELGCFTRSYYAYPQLITSTEELSESTYWISPNPVINELSINSAKTELVWVFIENLEGKLVFKEEVWTNNPINCGSFITGMYFVRIEKAAELNFVKFLKF